jgi:hypothetical protein
VTTGEQQDVATLQLLGVRRWGENDATPVVTDSRKACGTHSDHLRRGCIGLLWDNGRGVSGTVHLTTDDALRLSDLLRAMAEVDR